MTEYEPRITGFQLYQFDDPQELPYGDCVKEDADCRYGVLLISCAGRTGWGECLLTENRKYFDLAQWASFLQYFRRPTIQEAYDTLDKLQAGWGPAKADLVRSALDDLRRRLDGGSGGGAGRGSANEPTDASGLFEQCSAHYVIV